MQNKSSPRRSKTNNNNKNFANPAQPFASRLIVAFFFVIIVVLISSVFVMRVCVYPSVYNGFYSSVTAQSRNVVEFNKGNTA